jgi:hypothetical protein
MSFFTLCTIVEGLVPEYYRPSMVNNNTNNCFCIYIVKKLRNVLKKVGSNVDQRVFGELVEMRLPKLAAHFSEIGK